MTRRLLIALGTAVATQIPVISDALSCSCGWGTTEEMMEGASAVFVGEALNGSPIVGCACNRERATDFEVLEAFLGPETGTVTSVAHRIHSDSCGKTFKKGETYLVFAYGGSTGYCSAFAIDDAEAQMFLPDLREE